MKMAGRSGTKGAFEAALPISKDFIQDMFITNQE
jgi:hypothetical protein